MLHEMLPRRKTLVNHRRNDVNWSQKCYNGVELKVWCGPTSRRIQGGIVMSASQREEAEVGGLETENSVVSAAPIGVDGQAGPQVEDYDLEALTPLQAHYLETLRQLIAVKNEYQTAPEFEAWMMDAIKRSIYSALRDCIEANIGDIAKELLNREHQVN